MCDRQATSFDNIFHTGFIIIVVISVIITIIKDLIKTCFKFTIESHGELITRYFNGWFGEEAGMKVDGIHLYDGKAFLGFFLEVRIMNCRRIESLYIVQSFDGELIFLLLHIYCICGNILVCVLFMCTHHKCSFVKDV